MPRHHDPIPAIDRNFNDTDRKEVTVMSTLKDTVSKVRGLGDSGYRIQVVKHDCPDKHCHFDRMSRRVDVSPERPATVQYWCLNPNCVHYLSDMISYACHGSYPQRQVSTPALKE
jgi:hypothetical protein